MKSEAEPDDEELVKRLRSTKNTKARNEILAQLAERHGSKLLAALYRAFEGRFRIQDLEDLVQGALLKVVESIEEFDSKKGPFKRWIRRIAINQALMELRSRDAAKRGGGETTLSMSVDEDEGASAEPAVQDDPARRLEEEEAAKALLNAIEKLTPKQKAIVRSLMHSPKPDWMDDREVDEELARRHNSTVGGIRTERSKALSTLREALIPGRWKLE